MYFVVGMMSYATAPAIQPMYTPMYNTAAYYPQLMQPYMQQYMAATPQYQYVMMSAGAVRPQAPNQGAASDNPDSTDN